MNVSIASTQKGFMAKARLVNRKQEASGVLMYEWLSKGLSSTKSQGQEARQGRSEVFGYIILLIRKDVGRAHVAR